MCVLWLIVISLTPLEYIKTVDMQLIKKRCKDLWHWVYVFFFHWVYVFTITILDYTVCPLIRICDSGSLLLLLLAAMAGAK
jgi:hypothetical protein